VRSAPMFAQAPNESPDRLTGANGFVDASGRNLIEKEIVSLALALGAVDVGGPLSPAERELS